MRSWTTNLRSRLCIDMNYIVESHVTKRFEVFKFVLRGFAVEAWGMNAFEVPAIE